MKRAIGSPNKGQLKRQSIIREIGCVPCLLDGHPDTPCEVHHLNDRGRNIGHDATVGACAWHHRGVPLGNARPSEMALTHGPSLAKSPAEFAERYGNNDEMLAKQNALIATWIGCGA